MIIFLRGNSFDINQRKQPKATGDLPRVAHSPSAFVSITRDVNSYTDQDSSFWIYCIGGWSSIFNQQNSWYKMSVVGMTFVLLTSGM